MVNVVNVLATAEAIKRRSIADLSFDMSTFCNVGHQCGTRACIAGYAYALGHGVRNLRVVGSWYVRNEAAHWLGLDTLQQAQLFYCSDFMMPFENVTPRMAVNVLRRLARTGEVKWRRWW